MPEEARATNQHNKPTPSPREGVRLSFYCSILGEICQEEKIDLQWLSANWLAYLRKNGLVRQILGYKFDLNGAAASAAADDKSHTYNVLALAGLPAVEHQVFYEASNHKAYAEGHNSLADLAHYFETHHRDIVLKPNGEYASGGLGVTRLRNLDEAPQKLAEIFRYFWSASLSPFYELAAEYRVVILDDEARLIYRKEAGADWRFNLQNGARPRDVTDLELQSRLTDLAHAAAQALNLRFCSVDMVQPSQPATDPLLVLEVNSGVMILNYLNFFPERRQLVKEIYRDAIRKMFEPGVL